MGKSIFSKHGPDPAKREIQEADVAIIGAGPAGASCALGLRDCGLTVALIDQAAFPRDKVCGDAIPGPAIKYLHTYAAEAACRLSHLTGRHRVVSTELFASNGRSVRVYWKSRTFNMCRSEFDFFLFEEAVGAGAVFIQRRTASIQRTEGKLILKDMDQQAFLRTTLVIGCDGAHSVVRNYAYPYKIDRRHHVGAVRRYARNIENLTPGNNEMHLIPGYKGAYCWIFPLSRRLANVGMGMLSSRIAGQRVSLRNALQEALQLPHLKARFASAEFLEKPLGFGLPLASGFRPLVGDRCLLAGDAACLIDPLYGHGIDNAVLSGFLAAEQVRQCFRHQRFDVPFLKKYEEAVWEKLKPVTRRNDRTMRILSRFPFPLEWSVNLCQNAMFRKMIFQSAGFSADPYPENMPEPCSPD